MMGSLISRRRKTVKVEAKSISVQATECGIRDSLATTEQSTEVEASSEKQKTVMMELNIGDGLLPNSENNTGQITKEQCATSENRKRKVGLPKMKIRPQAGRKSHRQGSKDCSTQYDVFGVPYRVTPPNTETRNAEGKSPSFQTDSLKVEDISESNDDLRQEKLDITGEDAQAGSSILLSADNTAITSHTEGEDLNLTTYRKTVGLQLQVNGTARKTRAAVGVGERGQKCYPPNKEDADGKSSGLLQKETVESISNNLESASHPPRAVNSDKSLEKVSQKGVSCDAELTGLAARACDTCQQLSPPAGYQAGWNSQTEIMDNRDTNIETEKTEYENTNMISFSPTQPSGSHNSGSQIKKNDNKQENNGKQDSILEVEGKIIEADICNDEDIDEDTLDWNVDDRVRSPSDPEKEEDTDSCSCQEVIAESPNSDNEEGQEELMVKGYCSGSGGAGQEHDLVEDTLDTNVDDRVHSPSDTRSNDEQSSDEDDDTIDLLMNCGMGEELTLPGQRQNSLTTLKDGDSAEGSIYTPPSKSPYQKTKESAETDSTVSKDLVYVGQNVCRVKKECVPGAPNVTPQEMATNAFGVKVHTRESHMRDLSVSSAEHEGSMTVGTSNMENGSQDTSHRSLENVSWNTSHNSMENGSQNTSDCMTSSSTKDSTPQYGQNREGQTTIDNILSQENRPYSNTGNKGALSAINSHESTEPLPEGRTLLRDTSEIPDSSKNVTHSTKFGNQTGKLLMNLRDGTLSFGGEQLSKTVLEMQEAQAMTLLLFTGPLPCEGSEDVQRGAGDGQNVELSGVEVSDDTQDTDERAGLAAMLDTRSKSSCQLEQLQVEHSQLENSYNTAPFNPQLPQMNQLADDISAACAVAEDQPQAEPHVTIAAGQERNARPVHSNNILNQHVDHGAAAASFTERRIDNGPAPPQRTSPGAAASEGDWQTAQTEPLHQRFMQINNLGGLAASASSNRSHTPADYSHETAAVAHQTVGGNEAEPNTLLIEVQAAATTDTVAQSAQEEFHAQQNEGTQISGIISQRHEQNMFFPGYADVLRMRDNETPNGTSEDMEPNVQELNERERIDNPQRQIVEPALLQNGASTVPDQEQQTNEHNHQP